MKKQWKSVPETAPKCKKELEIIRFHGPQAAIQTLPLQPPPKRSWAIFLSSRLAWAKLNLVDPESSGVEAHEIIAEISGKSMKELTTC